VERRDDVRVAQLADRLRLLGEALGERRVAGGLRREDLDRDEAAERGPITLVDGAHAARADLLDDVVGAEPAPGLDGHEIDSTLNASTLVFRPFRSSAPSGVARTPSPAAARSAAEQITSPAFA